MFQWLSLFGQLGVWLLLCFYLVGSLGLGLVGWLLLRCDCCDGGRFWFVFVEIVVVFMFVVWIVSVC